MSILSRFKRVRKVADKPKKPAPTQSDPDPPPIPQEHGLGHAARAPEAVTPKPVSYEEIRARIAAAKKRKSELIASTTWVPHHTYSHARANSQGCSASRPMRRTPSDLSIDTMILTEDSQRLTEQPTGTSSFRSRQPSMQPRSYIVAQSRDRWRIEQQRTGFEYFSRQNSMDLSSRGIDISIAFSNPRKVPMPPPSSAQRPPSQPSSLRSSRTTAKSPLSNVFIGEAPIECFSDSSYGSSFSATSSEASSVIIKPEQRRRKRLSKMMSSLPKSKLAGNKPRESIEISLPYVSDYSVKTAKSTIPTWRYDDLARDSEPPILVETISAAHSRSPSRSLHFHRRGGSTSSRSTS